MDEHLEQALLEVEASWPRQRRRDRWRKFWASDTGWQLRSALIVGVGGAVMVVFAAWVAGWI